jgi:hypothetical protein
MIALKEHALRQTVVRKIHLRRSPQLQPPTTAVQILRQPNESERSDEFAMLKNSIGSNGRVSAASPGHLRGYLGDNVRFTRELHSEANEFALFATPSTGAPLTTDTAHLEAALEVLQPLDGQANSLHYGELPHPSQCRRPDHCQVPLAAGRTRDRSCRRRGLVRGQLVATACATFVSRSEDIPAPSIELSRG